MPLKFSLALIVVLLVMTLIEPSRSGADYPDLYLVPHNKAREDLGIPPLTWSRELVAYAYSTASKHRDDCKLEHSSGPYSENLAGGTGPIMTGTDATNMWVGEKEFYDPITKTCAQGKVCGHYTNIIEPHTHKMGCVKINCAKNGGLIFQCDYAR